MLFLLLFAASGLRRPSHNRHHSSKSKNSRPATKGEIIGIIVAACCIVGIIVTVFILVLCPCKCCYKCLGKKAQVEGKSKSSSSLSGSSSSKGVLETKYGPIQDVSSYPQYGQMPNIQVTPYAPGFDPNNTGYGNVQNYPTQSVETGYPVQQMINNEDDDSAYVNNQIIPPSNMPQQGGQYAPNGQPMMPLPQVGMPYQGNPMLQQPMNPIQPQPMNPMQPQPINPMYPPPQSNMMPNGQIMLPQPINPMQPPS